MSTSCGPPYSHLQEMHPEDIPQVYPKGQKGLVQVLAGTKGLVN